MAEIIDFLPNLRFNKTGRKTKYKMDIQREIMWKHVSSAKIFFRKQNI